MAMIHLDCKGLSCPVPIIEIARTCKGLQMGDTIEIESDDPAFSADLEAWVESMHYKLISITGDKVKIAVVEKTA